MFDIEVRPFITPVLQSALKFVDLRANVLKDYLEEVPDAAKFNLLDSE